MCTHTGKQYQALQKETVAKAQAVTKTHLLMLQPPAGSPSPQSSHQQWERGKEEAWSIEGATLLRVRDATLPSGKLLETVGYRFQGVVSLVTTGN